MLACACMCICLEVWLCGYNYLRNRHSACITLDISVFGKFRVNDWNLRHVEYRESCKKKKNAGCSLAAAMSVLFTLVLLFVWERKRVCVFLHSACLPGSIWINAFELWEREISKTAVNNIIQLLGFFCFCFFFQDMGVYCTGPHKNMTHGKLYKFSLSFLHIYYWYTTNYTLRSCPQLQM